MKSGPPAYKKLEKNPTIFGYLILIGKKLSYVN